MSNFFAFLVAIKYMICYNLLNKYNYDSQNIDFEFTNKNPFAKENSTAYKDRGYIGDYGSVYFIYLNPSPVKISK